MVIPLFPHALYKAVLVPFQSRFSPVLVSRSWIFSKAFSKRSAFCLLLALTSLYAMFAKTGRTGEPARFAFDEWCESDSAKTGPDGLSAASILVSVLEVRSAKMADAGAGAALELSARALSLMLSKRVEREPTRFKKVLCSTPQRFIVVPKLSYLRTTTLPDHKTLVDRREVIFVMNHDNIMMMLAF
jgi:hypothetical protein